MNIEVHDTAFVIAYYRAQHEILSQDPYAKLWSKDSLKIFADEFATQVSVYDEMLHCMRNRYFHDELQELATTHKDLLFINLGAGFSMYPYSLPDSVISVEVDFKEIMLYKDITTDTFLKEGKLPKRKVKRIAADITNAEGQQKIKETISEFENYTKVILIEGVFFFLNKRAIETVLNFCADIQSKDDLVLCISFDESQNETKVFKRLKQYFSETLQSHENPYTCLPHKFYENIEGYSLKKKYSTLALGKQLGCIETSVKEEEILNEHCYTLFKIR
ncbi:class I SAM-dependent methyltransferase [Patiriisocius hiemis]|uniref:Class I SAM-dependent methyltransferase n=1 Tax=Patiriisocius hiemis TaxID=3075604 RepID=A0ABU2YFJ7_9FLAO|nr:class I SAM-dependent methyltransferase [Constantimarinum sp. W242]MDT0556957.1 class I SAM-dependent methyltransferase [Constantimarinum sp. W242]